MPNRAHTPPRAGTQTPAVLPGLRRSRSEAPYWMKNTAESASYLKMLDAVNAAATNQAACKAIPYGIWQDGICRFAIFGTDAWVSVLARLLGLRVCSTAVLRAWEPASRGLGAQPRLPPSLARGQLELMLLLPCAAVQGKDVAAATTVCQALSKDNQTCLSKSPMGGPINEERFQEYKNYPEGAGPKPSPSPVK